LHRQAEKAARKGNIEEAIQVRGQRVLTKLLKNVVFRKHKLKGKALSSASLVLLAGLPHRESCLG